MPERPAYIVDASVVARWHLKNPPYVEQAIRVRDDYRDGRIALLAPDNFRYEVAGAIRHAVSAHAISARRGEELIQDFLDWQIPTVEAADLVLPAYRLSVRLGCSFYDAIYLVLAEMEHLQVIHADRNLRNAIGQRFPLELWVEDYTASI